MDRWIFSTDGVGFRSGDDRVDPVPERKSGRLGAVKHPAMIGIGPGIEQNAHTIGECVDMCRWCRRRADGPLPQRLRGGAGIAAATISRRLGEGLVGGAPEVRREAAISASVRLLQTSRITR